MKLETKFDELSILSLNIIEFIFSFLRLKVRSKEKYINRIIEPKTIWEYSGIT